MHEAALTHDNRVQLPYRLPHPRDPMHDGSDDLYIERQAELLRERAAIDEFSEEELLRRPWGSALETLRSAMPRSVTSPGCAKRCGARKRSECCRRVHQRHQE